MESKKRFKKSIIQKKVIREISVGSHYVCRKSVKSTVKDYLHNFPANNLARKRRRIEKLSKRITKLPYEHDNSNK